MNDTFHGTQIRGLTNEEIQRHIAEGHRLRSEMVHRALKRAFAALIGALTGLIRRIQSVFQASGRHPADGNRLGA